MPSISLEKGLLRITLTPAEAANYGFALNQPQLLRKKKETTGALVLEISSIDLAKTSEAPETTVWIPPALILSGLSGSPAVSTKKPGALPISSKLVGEIEDWERPSGSSVPLDSQGNELPY